MNPAVAAVVAAAGVFAASGLAMVLAPRGYTRPRPAPLAAAPAAGSGLLPCGRCPATSDPIIHIAVGGAHTCTARGTTYTPAEDPQ